MGSDWGELDYRQWQETCDTVHALTQVLGKLAVVLAPPEPQLQHAALRIGATGWETNPLPAPDDSGALTVGLDLRGHEVVVQHSDGRDRRLSLVPARPVGEVTRELLATLESMVGAVEIDPTPQEVDWTVPLDQDEVHRTYDPAQVENYFDATVRVALALAEFRAPYRGRSTPVNAWWGSFDLAVSLFSGGAADPPMDGFIMRNAMDSQSVEVGWWPGDERYPHAAFFAYAHPAPDHFSEGLLEPETAHWSEELGEFILNWEDVRRAADPHAEILAFARSAFQHACLVCGWEPEFPASMAGEPPPLR